MERSDVSSGQNCTNSEIIPMMDVCFWQFRKNGVGRRCCHPPDHIGSDVCDSYKATTAELGRWHFAESRITRLAVGAKDEAESEKVTQNDICTVFPQLALGGSQESGIAGPGQEQRSKSSHPAPPQYPCSGVGSLCGCMPAGRFTVHVCARAPLLSRLAVQAGRPRQFTGLEAGRQGVEGS
eukprot:gene10426-biopygen7760